MKKVLVAEIGESIIALNAFGDLDHAEAKHLSQVVLASKNQGLEQTLQKALILLEDKLGGPVLNSETDIYLISSSREETVNGKVFGEANLRRTLSTHTAFHNMVEILLEEVGDTLILAGDEEATGLYLIQKDRSFLSGRGAGVYGGETEREIALAREVMTTALRDAVLRFCQGEARDLRHLRWVIGTGGVLTQTPGESEVVREALSQCQEITWPQDGYPVLIDQYNILTSLGALPENYRRGAWQLLLESLGVDS